jgi:hypothetical protein
MKSALTKNGAAKNHKQKKSRQSQQSKAESKAVRPSARIDEDDEHDEDDELDEEMESFDPEDDEFAADMSIEEDVEVVANELAVEMREKIAKRVRESKPILPADLFALCGEVTMRLTGLAPTILIRLLAVVERQCLMGARNAKLRLQRLENADDERAQEAADDEWRARSAVVLAAEALGRARAMFPEDE